MLKELLTIASVIGVFVVCIGGAIFGLRFLGRVNALDVERERAERLKRDARFEELIATVESNPGDETSRNNACLLAQRFPEYADKLYRLALRLLEERPDVSGLKEFALSSGRASYSSKREDGAVTIYDEQAIQNDISVRV